ncbi:phage tail protein [Psychrobacillus sp. FSL K6-1267]|uniref:phage tail protein n=1 Tax=Psychrobacillus sp. FSL K6-1267 TaxID=2921543 RepID=UPI0030FB0471
MDEYTSTQGDTWDYIAYKTLGSEYLLPLLLEANQKYRHIVIFPGNITLKVPNVEIDDISDRPEWLGEDEDL